MNGFGKPIPSELMSLDDLNKKVQSMRMRLYDAKYGSLVQRLMRSITCSSLQIEAQQCLSYSYGKLHLLSPMNKVTLKQLLADKNGIVPEHVLNTLYPPEARAAD